MKYFVTISRHFQKYGKQILPCLHDLTMSSIPGFFCQQDADQGFILQVAIVDNAISSVGPPEP